MPDDYRISDLSTVSSLGNSDLMEVSAVNSQSESGYTSMKMPVTTLANKVVNNIQYAADLQTESKTIIGAINEVAQGGGGDAEIIKTASGAIASFETEFSAPLHSLKATINASGGGGTPDNPIPIVGFTECNITACGVNLWDEEWELGGFNADGTTNSRNDVFRTKNYIQVPPNTVLHIHQGNLADTDWCYPVFYDINKTPITRGVGYGTITMPANAYYLRVQFNTAMGNTYANNISLNYPATDHAYHAYNGQTITLDLNGTRYGGYVDANNGKLVVTWGSVDLGTLTWVKIGMGGGRYGFRAGISDMALTPAANVKINAVCECYSVDTGNNIYLGNVGLAGWGVSTHDIAVYDDTLESGDATAFKTAMDGMELAYELATPLEIDISPEHLYANVGQNNVFHDCNGETEVKYYTKTAGEIKQFIEDDVEVSDLAGVPDLPSTDGTYILKVTITDGVPTFSWEAEA